MISWQIIAKWIISTVLNGVFLIVIISCTEKSTEEDVQPVLTSEDVVVPQGSVITTSFYENAVIDPFDTIKLTFEYKLDEEVTYYDYLLKLKVDSIFIRQGDQFVDLNLLWVNDSIGVHLKSNKTLAPDNAFTLGVRLHWEYFSGEEWKIYDQKQEISNINRDFHFSTPGLSKVLDEEDIQITYPRRNQYHFLVDEYDYGMIQLQRDRSDILLNEEKNIVIGIKSLEDNSAIMIDGAYDYELKRIKYKMTKDLNAETIYELIVGLKANDNSTIDTIFSYHFRTSVHRNFSEKFTELYPQMSSINVMPFGINREYFWVNLDMESSEALDYYESKDGLLRYKFITEGNNWYENYIAPRLYDFIESSEYEIDHREEMPYGIPPVYCIQTVSNSGFDDALLGDNHIENLNAPSLQFNYVSIRYWGMDIMNKDLYDIKNALYTLITDGGELTEEENEFLETEIELLKPGTYSFEIEYIIPIIDSVSFQNTFSGVY